MVAHVVLFTPKAAMTAGERDRFVDALETALRDIPQITRATIGRRFLTGRPYDAMPVPAYVFLAVIEFRTREDLLGYLDHPAHVALARQFYLQAERAAAYDFEMVDAAETRTLVS